MRESQVQARFRFRFRGESESDIRQHGQRIWLEPDNSQVKGSANQPRRGLVPCHDVFLKNSVPDPTLLKKFEGL